MDRTGSDQHPFGQTVPFGCLPSAADPPSSAARRPELHFGIWRLQIREVFCGLPEGLPRSPPVWIPPQREERDAPHSRLHDELRQQRQIRETCHAPGDHDVFAGFGASFVVF